MKPRIYMTVEGAIKEEYSFKNTLFYKDVLQKRVYCRCCFSLIKSKKAYSLALWWDLDGNGHNEWNKRRWYCNDCFNALIKAHRF